METALALLAVMALYFIGMYIFGMVNKNTPEFRGNYNPKRKPRTKK